jgi:hypothetical protein
MSGYAPVIIFTYRRKPEKLIESLLRNDLAAHTDLFIFSDGQKNENDVKDILETREYLKQIKGFKTIEIIESENNKGLANSIINGVTDVINNYDKVIVLEDDLVVAENLLEYMNEALDFYDNNNKIWAISGYCPPIDCFKEYDKDVFLSVRSSSWGWATWRNKWNLVDWKVKSFQKIRSNKELIKKFNLGGNDMYKMLELQMLGKIDSWAIRWCYSQFEHHMYTVYPVKSKIKNEGFGDNKGIHNNSVYNNKWNVSISSKKIKFEDVDEDMKIIECFKKFHDLNITTQIGYFMRKYGGYYLTKKLYSKFRRFL